MLRPEIGQLDVTYGGIDAAQQLPVSVQRGRPCAGALLQIQDIGSIVGKGLLVINARSLLQKPSSV